ncbi:MAG: prepilin-type N-terminal cleavage/methylation domain-containing protein [Phycisphaeraceae bacterium]|nr:prepilin-type N-terminal cleavage/methylation domain-containing protein [Phycisphaeraceae bacterium]
MPRRKSLHGFTLIELLVVISIIALLISILLPALRKSRDTAMNAKCLSNLHQVGVAMLGYQADEGRLPVHLVEATTGTWYYPNQISRNLTGSGGPTDLRQLYLYYVSDINFMQCPFCPEVDRSLAAIPWGEQRVYVNYVLTPGFWMDFDGLRFNTKKRWTRTEDQWLYDGHRMQVIAGDVMLANGLSYVINHENNAGGFTLNQHQGSSPTDYTDSYYFGTFSEDPRPRLTANYALRDGSAAAYAGNDERLIPVYVPNAFSRNYLLPAQP